MIERKGRTEILKRTLERLRKGPSSVHQIAEQLGSNWSTAKRSLNTLEEFGLVSQLEKKGVARDYVLIKKVPPSIAQSDSLFNLKLTKDKIEASKYLYSKIKERWYQENQQIPNKIQTQKVASEIVRNFRDLKIPSVWYLYGNMLVLTYNPSENYSGAYAKELNTPEIDKAITISVKKYSTKKNSFEIMRQQYTEEDKKEYLLRLELVQNLTFENLDDTRNQAKISELLAKLIAQIPRHHITDKAHKFLAEFYGLLNRAFDQKFAVTEYRGELLTTFNKIWELIALFYFYESAKLHFAEATILASITPKMSHTLLEVQELLFELESIFPQNIMGERIKMIGENLKLKSPNFKI